MSVQSATENGVIPQDCPTPRQCKNESKSSGKDGIPFRRLRRLKLSEDTTPHVKPFFAGLDKKLYQRISSYLPSYKDIIHVSQTSKACPLETILSPEHGEPFFDIAQKFRGNIENVPQRWQRLYFKYREKIAHFNRTVSLFDLDDVLKMFPKLKSLSKNGDLFLELSNEFRGRLDELPERYQELYLKNRDRITSITYTVSSEDVEDVLNMFPN